MDHESGLTALEQAVLDLLKYCRKTDHQLAKGRDLSQALLGRPFEREQDDILLDEALRRRITDQIGIWRQSRGLGPDDMLQPLTAEEQLRIDIGTGNSRLEALSLVRAYYLDHLSKEDLMQILSLQERRVETKIQAGRREVCKLITLLGRRTEADRVEEPERRAEPIEEQLDSGSADGDIEEQQEPLAHDDIDRPEPIPTQAQQVGQVSTRNGRRSYLVVGSLLLTVLVGVVIAPLFRPQEPGQNPLQGEVLYAADWSKGRMNWLGFESWKTIDGMLVHDGSSQAMQIIAPYEPNPLTNYAVEAEIQVVGQIPEEKSFGIIVRGEKREEGKDKSYVGYFGVISPTVFRISGDHILKSHPLKQNPNWFNEWHTYRLEVEGNNIRLFADDILLVETMDNKYVTGGRLGLWSNQTQLNVRAFRVIKL